MTRKNGKIMNYLIEQCKNPTGFVGARMVDIWNKTFVKMALWGLSTIQIEPSNQLLEIGCGGGEIVNQLAKRLIKGKIVGVDISQTALKKAIDKNRVHIELQRAEIIQATAEALPFEAQTFHHVLAIQTHFYWDNLAKALSEIYRVLQENGSCQLICEKDKISYHLPEFENCERMKELLSKIGFKEIKVRETERWIQYSCVKLLDSEGA